MKINLEYKITDKDTVMNWDLDKHRSVNIVALTGEGKTYLLEHILSQTGSIPTYLLTNRYGDDLDPNTKLTEKFNNLTLETLIERLEYFISQDYKESIFIIQRILYDNNKEDIEKLNKINILLEKLLENNYIITSHRPSPYIKSIIWNFDIQLIDVRSDVESTHHLKTKYESLIPTGKSRGHFFYIDKDNETLVKVPDKEPKRPIYLDKIKKMYVVKDYLIFIKFIEYSKTNYKGTVEIGCNFLYNLYEELGNYFVELENGKYKKISKEQVEYYKYYFKQQFIKEFIE